MAYKGSWGIFVDIPRARSNWTRKALSVLDTPVMSGGLHGLPAAYSHGEFVWAWVREPAEWLRSFFTYRLRQDWKVTGNKDSQAPWHVLYNATNQFATDNFKEFVTNVGNERPGLVGWFYGMLIPPWVHWKQCEEAEIWLNAWFGITKFPEPVNRTPKEFVPDITEEIRNIIRFSELSTYIQYDYPL